MSELGNLQGMSRIRGNWPLRFAILFALVVPAGCVGGAGSYFESVSLEEAATERLEETAEIDSAEAASDGVAENAPIALGVIEPQSLPTSDASQQAQLGPAENYAAGLSAGAVVPEGDTSTTDLPGVSTAFVPSAEPVDGEGAIQLVSPNTAEILPDNNLPPANIDPSNRTALAALPDTGGLFGGFSIGSESQPFIDPLEQAAEMRIPTLHASIDHGQCKGGWGPKPRKINAKNIEVGDNYYIEIRMRHTPMLPVGHTYVAYGKLGPNGQPIDEHLVMLAPVGGYAGAALASGIPMPGVLTPHRDDCLIRPAAAYRVSLDAQEYEKLLREVGKAKREKPKYLLFTYNCNHFMSRIARSVGLKPPKNIYVPALEYIYAMIEANEGGRISRL